MDRIAAIRSSRDFKLKKWLIITKCVIEIVASLTLALIFTLFLDSLNGTQYVYYDRTTNKTLTFIFQSDGLIAFLWIGVIISICLAVMGLIAAHKEHYSCTIAYGVVEVISLLFCICFATYQPFYWISVLLYLLIIVVIVCFIRDLRKIRSLRRENTGVMFVNGRAPTANVYSVTTTPTAPSAPAYPTLNLRGSVQTGQQIELADQWEPPIYSVRSNKV